MVAGWRPDAQGLRFWVDPGFSGFIAADGLPLDSVSLSGGTPATLATTLVGAQWLAAEPHPGADRASARPPFGAFGGSLDPASMAAWDGTGCLLQSTTPEGSAVFASIPAWRSPAKCRDRRQGRRRLPEGEGRAAGEQGEVPVGVQQGHALANARGGDEAVERLSDGDPGLAGLAVEPRGQREVVERLEPQHGEGCEMVGHLLGLAC
jgi:hypothetical protein